jgi:hypothetical protein
MDTAQYRLAFGNRAEAWLHSLGLEPRSERQRVSVTAIVSRRQPNAEQLFGGISYLGI